RSASEKTAVAKHSSTVWRRMNSARVRLVSWVLDGGRGMARPVELRRLHMQAKAIAAATALGLAAFSWSSPSADAATCVRNSVFNDVGGHRTLIKSETRCGVAPRFVLRAP